MVHKLIKEQDINMLNPKKIPVINEQIKSTNGQVAIFS